VHCAGDVAELYPAAIEALVLNVSAVLLPEAVFLRSLVILYCFGPYVLGKGEPTQSATGGVCVYSASVASQTPLVDGYLRVSLRHCESEKCGSCKELS
jgi:hypothetical protein